MNTNRLGGRKGYAKVSLYLLLVMALFVLAACGDSDSDKDKNNKAEDMVTVGILSPAAVFDAMIDGFKTDMAENGYVEGENITYIRNDPAQEIETALDNMLSEHEFDLFLTAGTPATTLAKSKLEASGIPVVFAPVNDPVASGLVESLAAPGGNLTGIQPPNTTGKVLEWLQRIVPDAKRVFVPNDPTDGSSVLSVNNMQEPAEALGFELVVVEASTEEELDAITQDFPEDVDAVFLPRAGSLTNRISGFVETANAQGIPVLYPEIGAIIDDGVMIGYGASYAEMGTQAARLARAVLEGTEPATLPVEVAESFLAINLDIADTIGVEIPDNILRSAYQLVQSGS
ncbi:MAG: hypothetical protein JXQ72_09025 [Anaerolineae bacterium]|nr:hypothetical protein [Anaerolineae bacterium]